MVAFRHLLSARLFIIERDHLHTRRVHQSLSFIKNDPFVTSCICCPSAGITSIEMRLLQLLRQLATHLNQQLPWQLPELLTRLQHPKVPEDIRTFGLSWAQEVLKASDNSAPNTIFSTVLAILTTDSSPKMRSAAAKGILELIPTCSQAVQLHTSQLAAAACLGLADTSQDVTKDCERLLSSIAPLFTCGSQTIGHQGTSVSACSLMATKSSKSPLVPHGPHDLTGDAPGVQRTMQGLGI